eukprot:TRINITY_DN10749_c0_g1_i1.p1 TRINITY_DN10749_c0_g1~~TRINITY_DN10749_c0_g1_i1.p1  ORF type:complete len:124 (+),score=34.40 TRINITY_DN10749_c0_g1_i1:329-700(+)
MYKARRGFTDDDLERFSGEYRAEVAQERKTQPPLSDAEVERLINQAATMSLPGPRQIAPTSLSQPGASIFSDATSSANTAQQRKVHRLGALFRRIFGPHRPVSRARPTIALTTSSLSSSTSSS